MITVPALDTDRLALRGHVLSDYDASLALWSDPEVTRYIGGRPCTPEEVWARLLRYVGHWALLGFGYWVVEEKASGRFVGEVGFADFRRDIEPPLGGAPEAGWVLSPAMHGKGYATEAVRAVLAWGDARFGRARAVCLIGPENGPSLRVAGKCGFREVRRATYKGGATIVLER
jgi:RimJ/RimL family protein N-acetyltransferase